VCETACRCQSSMREFFFVEGDMYACNMFECRLQTLCESCMCVKHLICVRGVCVVCAQVLFIACCRVSNLCTCVTCCVRESHICAIPLRFRLPCACQLCPTPLCV